MEEEEDKPKPKMASQPLTVTQVQLASWPVQRLPHFSAVLSLINHLTRPKGAPPKSPQ